VTIDFDGRKPVLALDLKVSPIGSFVAFHVRKDKQTPERRGNFTLSALKTNLPLTKPPAPAMWQL